MKAVNIFMGADMRLGHAGLAAYAARYNVKLSAMAPGQALVFINRRRSMMKVYSWNNVVSSLRQTELERPIDLAAIEYLAQAFDPNGAVNYEKALKLALTEKLSKKGKLDESMLNDSGKTKVLK